MPGPRCVGLLTQGIVGWQEAAASAPPRPQEVLSASGPWRESDDTMDTAPRGVCVTNEVTLTSSSPTQTADEVPVCAGAAARNAGFKEATEQRLIVQRN